MARKKAEETDKPKSVSPFAYVSAVQEQHENQLGSDALPLKDLNRFMLIRGVGNHPDTIFHGAAANRLTNVSDEMVFYYLHAAISPKARRFGKFPKKPKEDKNLMARAEELNTRYNIGMSSAMDAAKLEEELQ